MTARAMLGPLHRSAAACLLSGGTLLLPATLPAAEDGHTGTVVEPEADDEGTPDGGERVDDEHFLLTANGGYGYANLRTFETRSGDTLTADLVPSHVSGPYAAVGAAFRLSVLTLGVRGTFMRLQGDEADGPIQDMNLWTLDGELGFRVPLGPLEPHFLLGGGYSAFGGFNHAASGINDGLNITGANLRAGVGLDYYVTPTFSIGALATAELMFLNRRGIPIRELTRAEMVETVGEAKARVLEADGSSLGAAYVLAVGPGLHF